MRARFERRAVLLAWWIGVVCLVVIVASLILLALDWRAIDSPSTALLPFFLQASIVGTLGVLIAARRPGNRVGWFLLAMAVSDVSHLLAGFVAIRGQLSGATPGSWVEWPAWVFSFTGTLGLFFLAFVILFFPDGRLLPGPRWRSAAWVVLFAIVVLIAGSMVQVTPIQVSPRLSSVANLLAVPAVKALNGLGDVLGSVSLLSLLLLLVTAVAVRFRRSHAVERTQLRWFAYVAAASLGLLVLSFPFPSGSFGDVTWAAGLLGLTTLIPATIGLAIMRHGLYDIDVFISRTLVYGSLAVFITAVYVGIAVGIGTLVGSGGKPNLALSILATAIVAIGFQPVRERVQKVANRLVYGQRATPYEVLSEFSGRVAETYAADDVLPRMARVLQEGAGAESATVWLRGTAELRPAATFPEAMGAHPSLPMRNGTLPTLPGATRAVEVRHRGELLGALSVNKRRGEGLTPIEQKLVDDLAHQAGLVLKNVGLTADLQARLVDLRASRQRLVAAQDGERRKLERDLHDGAQQYLVAIKVKLGLVEMLLTKDPAKAMTTLEQLKGDADEALETLRDLARGIYPPLLAEKGLPTALQAQARKATLPIIVAAEGIGRYPQDTEAALYFCILEALQNIQKYAQASRAVVRLKQDGDLLTVEVNDDGRGFVVSTTARGNGLTNMEDRLDALGGNLQVESTVGRGTTLRASVPVTHQVLAGSAVS
jgi:signal transduction histidine kinase